MSRSLTQPSGTVTVSGITNCFEAVVPAGRSPAHPVVPPSHATAAAVPGAEGDGDAVAAGAAVGGAAVGTTAGGGVGADAQAASVTRSSAASAGTDFA